MKTIDVVAAMIQVEDMILDVHRKENENSYTSLKWDFPGGKLEEGERPEDAVIRVVNEEFQLAIHPVASIGLVVYEYPDIKVDPTLVHCALIDRLPIMNEHTDLVWSNKSLLATFDWTAADRDVLQQAGLLY